MKFRPSVQQKVAIDLAIIAIAVVLLTMGGPSGNGTPAHEAAPVFIGLYVIYLGFLFLLSYYFSDASYVLKLFLWICEHFSHPRGRQMAFFYFALLLLLGGCALLSAFGFLR